MIDAHCHLIEGKNKDIKLYLEESFHKNIKGIILNGYDLNSSKKVVEWAQKYNNVYAAIGIHPSYLDSFNQKDFIKLEKLLLEPKVIAIGEIGLDYFKRQDNVLEQQKLFNQQLKLAKKYKKPVIIHNREATSDVYKYLKKCKVQGLLHSYDDNLFWVNKFIKLNMLFGVGGLITFKNKESLREVIKKVPLEYILLETDSPYLTPEPFRGKENHPSNLIYIANKLAEIKDCSLGLIKEKTVSNAVGLFDLH
ncbi:MAG: TatD family hydrolase [Bacilli bacterium]|jgi:TatD DNase family protein